MNTVERIEQYLNDNEVVLFMKGSPKFPLCGFSAQVVQALKACDVNYEHVDILQDPDIRSEIKTYANWPTFPQLYVNGELIGGCDIIMELHQRGELADTVRVSA